MKIHILGASGFIGNSLLKEFNKKGEYLVKGYSSKDCNLVSSKSIENALYKLTKEDVIIMTSSITRLKGNSLESMMKNVTMAENISKFIEKNNPSQLIFLSTIDVYGINPLQPINENLLPEPNDYYALSKLASEFILKKSCSSKDIPLLILRLSGVYGKGDKGKSTINKLIESAKQGKITIYGDGEDKRDFVHVIDIYEVIKKGIKNKINATLNIATGKSHTINKIVEKIKLYCPKKFSIKYKQKKLKRIKEMKCDISLLKKTFPDFEPRGIEEGLFSYIKNSEYF